MFLKIVLALAALIAVFLIVAAFQPSHYRIARTVRISAPPAAVFAQVNDFHRWASWNPWGKIDPAMTATYEGAPAGVGAIYTWSGNRQVGAGRMTIADSRPHDLIRIDMAFFKPLANTATVEFAFKPEGHGTAVTWSIFGPQNFVGKMMGLVMNMDKMIGGQFEQGLADLRIAAEATTAK
jgi:uncharacterized protein YndB with AHSA1/START domain